MVKTETPIVHLQIVKDRQMPRRMNLDNADKAAGAVKGFYGQRVYHNLLCGQLPEAGPYHTGNGRRIFQFLGKQILGSGGISIRK